MRVLVLSALLGLVASKTLVFKASECNVNFNDAKNFFSPDATDAAPATDPSASGSAAPSSVSFAGIDGSFESIDVRVSAGSYEMGELVMQDDMVISLDEDGVEMTFNEEAKGTPAVFTAGQTTEKGACSIGCHKNFVAWDGVGGLEKAAIASFEMDAEGVYVDSDMTPTDTAPCNTDTIVIPKGYNVNLLAMGFHAVKKVAYMQGEELIVIGNEAQLPEFMMYPRAQGDFFIGDRVTDKCQDAGMIGTGDQCICATECPVDDTQALAQANAIANAQERFSTKSLNFAEKAIVREDVSFIFRNAFPETDTLTMGGCDKIFSENQAEDFVREFSGNQITADFDRVILKEGHLDGIISVTAVISGDHNYPILNQELTLDMDVTAENGPETRIAKIFYHAIMTAAARKNCITEASLAEVLEAVGAKEEVNALTTVYAGNTMSQMEVYALANEDNAGNENSDGVVDMVHKTLLKTGGFTSINKPAMRNSWKTVTPEERKAAEQGRNRREAPVRYGLATNLIQVVLEYSRWSHSAEPDASAIERTVNHVMATYDTETHHSCFAFQTGFDDLCINELVADLVAEELSKCDDSVVAQCRAAAVVSAKSQIMTIKGCGLLGKNPDGECVDPAAAVAAEDLANVAADAAALTASLAIETEYNRTEAIRIAEEKAAAAKALAERLAKEQAERDAIDKANNEHKELLADAKVNTLLECSVESIAGLEGKVTAAGVAYDEAYAVVEADPVAATVEQQRALELARLQMNTLEFCLDNKKKGTAAEAPQIKAEAAAEANKKADALKEELDTLQKELAKYETSLADSGSAVDAAQQEVDACEAAVGGSGACSDDDQAAAAKKLADATELFQNVQALELKVAKKDKDAATEGTTAELAAIQKAGQQAGNGDPTPLAEQLSKAKTSLTAAKDDAAALAEQLKTIQDKPLSAQSKVEELTAQVLAMQLDAATQKVDAIETKIKLAEAEQEGAINKQIAQADANDASDAALKEAEKLTTGELIPVVPHTDLGEDLKASADGLDNIKAAIAKCDAAIKAEDMCTDAEKARNSKDLDHYTDIHAKELAAENDRVVKELAVSAAAAKKADELMAEAVAAADDFAEAAGLKAQDDGALRSLKAALSNIEGQIDISELDDDQAGKDQVALYGLQQAEVQAQIEAVEARIVAHEAKLVELTPTAAPGSKVAGAEAAGAEAAAEAKNAVGKAAAAATELFVADAATVAATKAFDDCNSKDDCKAKEEALETLVTTAVDKAQKVMADMDTDQDASAANTKSQDLRTLYRQDAADAVKLQALNDLAQKLGDDEKTACGALDAEKKLTNPACRVATAKLDTLAEIKAAVEQRQKDTAASIQQQAAASQANPPAPAAPPFPVKNEVSTVLTQDAKVGGKVLQIESSDGFKVNDAIKIGSERNTIAGFGSIILAKPLANNHPAGTIIAAGETDEEYEKRVNNWKTQNAAAATKAKADAAAATKAKADADAAAAKKEDGPPIMIIAIAAGVVVLLLIVIVVMFATRPSGGGAGADKASHPVVAFENPMYDDPAGDAMPMGADEPDSGLYDEPTFQEDVAEKENPMYASNDDAVNTGAGGGYLDVQPDDDDDEDDDDDDDDDDDEEEEEESDDDEESDE